METEISEQRLAEKPPVEADGCGQDEPVFPSSSQLAIEDIFDEQYPTGLTLIAVLVPMVLVQFVIKLDMSIIATVQTFQRETWSLFLESQLTTILGDPKDYQRVSIFARCGLVWKCVSTR